MKEHIWHPCTQMKDHEDFPPVRAQRGEGLYIYDENGKAYMDIISSWWCNLLGHGNPRIKEAVKKQLDQLEHVMFAGFTHRPAEELCSLLTELLPQGLEKFFFVDSGATAAETAMKMSFQYHSQTGSPQRRRFMTLANGYHGENLGTLAVGGMDRYTKIFEPLLFSAVHVPGPDCFRCPYGKNREHCSAECIKDAEQAFAAYGKETSAFLLEPIVQGAAGMRIYPAVYLKKIRELCDSYCVHLIADEIAVGYGRTGKMFACEHAGITPDFMCLSKGLTGGFMPMALTVTKDEIYEAFYGDFEEGRTFMHSTTYSGNPLACAAAVEVLHILKEEQVLKHTQAAYLQKRMQEVFGGYKNVGEIRGIGLIRAIELVEDVPAKKPFAPEKRIGYEIYKAAMERGLMLRPIGETVYFNPPLTITRPQIDRAVELCRESIEEVLGR